MKLEVTGLEPANLNKPGHYSGTTTVLNIVCPLTTLGARRSIEISLLVYYKETGFTPNRSLFYGRFTI